MQPTLDTERLCLRPFRKEDAKNVQTLAGDFAIADTTLNVPHPYQDGMAEEWISSHAEKYAARGMAVFAVVLKKDDTLAGTVGLTLDHRFHRAELGYWIGVSFWNRGVCTEAAGAVIGFGFDTLKLHKISACHLSRNPASGKVMRKRA